MADEILYRLIDERMTSEEIIREGFSKDTVEKIIKKIKLSQYKRKLPTIAKVSKRTMGMEFRYPRDWGSIANYLVYRGSDFIAKKRRTLKRRIR